jgi:hypothetical protein
MNFLPDVYVTCEVCRGRRYNAETLAVQFKGHSISDLLNLPVENALPLLEDIPQIQQKLQTLVDVGLGYVQLGQSSTTLSAGPAHLGVSSPGGRPAASLHSRRTDHRPALRRREKAAPGPQSPGGPR